MTTRRGRVARAPASSLRIARLGLLAAMLRATGCIHSAKPLGPCCTHSSVPMTKLLSEHISLILPNDGIFYPQYILKVAEAGILYYSKLFGVPAPGRRFWITLCGIGTLESSPEPPGREGDPRSGGLRAYATTNEVCAPYIPAFPRLGVKQSGDLEGMVMHELAYLFEGRVVHFWEDAPTWFRKGLAGLLAFYYLSGDDPQALAKLPVFSQQIWKIAIAEEDKQLIPLDRLFSQHKGDSASLREAESFALLLYADDVIGHSEMIRLLRSFENGKSRVEARTIGDRIVARLPGGATRQEDWLKWLHGRALGIKWTRFGAELRLVGQDLFIQPLQGGYGVVINTEGATAIGSTIEAGLRWQFEGAHSLDVMLGRCGEEAMGVTFDQSGATSISGISLPSRPEGRAHGTHRTLTLSPIRSPISDPLRDHRVTVHFGEEQRITAYVDDVLALDARLPCAVTGWLWGFILVDGGIEVKSPRLLPAGEAPQADAPHSK